MSIAKAEKHSLTVSEIARRWSISRERVRALIESDRLPGFTVPSSGRFGETVRVLRTIVEAFEHEGLSFDKIRERKEDMAETDRYWRRQIAKL